MADIIGKMRMLLSLNTLIMMVCSSLLSYQTYELFEQYNSSNIVTNIVILKNSQENIPAITVCYDQMLSFVKIVSELNSTMSEGELRNFTNLMERYFFFYAMHPIENVHFYTDYKEFVNRYYDMKRKLTRTLERNLISYHHFIQKFTLPYFGTSHFSNKRIDHIRIFINDENLDNGLFVFKRCVLNYYFSIENSCSII